MKLKSDLVRAVEHGEFELYYQPKVLLRTGEILWMEGLLRWNHPERGLLLPGEFIPTAEESGLIVSIGRWAMQEALRQSRRWRDRNQKESVEQNSGFDEISDQTRGGTPVPAVCVNLSARQLNQEGLAQEVADMLQETRTDPESFGIEITESVLMEDEHALGTLKELKNMGMTISIDDFGTGYSSLSYLQRFPASVLKIDCSFIRGFEENPQNAVMISGMTNLAHATGKAVVAECIENTRQLALLKKMGCEMGQGNLFSKPLPPEAAMQLLATYSPNEFSVLEDRSAP